MFSFYSVVNEIDVHHKNQQMKTLRDRANDFFRDRV